MAELENDEIGKKAGSQNEATPGPAAAEEEMEEEWEDDRGPGFDPDQRRFLWTITIVLVLAMFASTGLNIAYLDRQRSHQIAAAKATDTFRVYDEAFNQSKQNEGQAMVRSLVAGDTDTYQKAFTHLMGIYAERQHAYSEMRREEGLDDANDDPTGTAFASGFEASVKRAAAQYRAQSAATQPATTQSAATQSSATHPSAATQAASQGPATPPVPPTGP